MKDNMNINGKSKTSKRFCCPKGLEKMNISPKRLTTLKISVYETTFEESIRVPPTSFHVKAAGH